MFPLLLLIPGGLILWTIAQSFAKRDAARVGFIHEDHRHHSRHHFAPVHHRGEWHRDPWGHAYPAPYPAVSYPAVVFDPVPAFRRESRPVNAADYLHHINEAMSASRTLDTVKPYALAADIASLMQAPDEAVHALAVLSAPLDVTFAQKDLNVLGASPPVPEDGVMGRATVEAIKGIQARFKQPVTGKIDPTTAVAIRYAVGCIHSQDKAASQ